MSIASLTACSSTCPAPRPFKHPHACVRPPEHNGKHRCSCDHTWRTS